MGRGWKNKTPPTFNIVLHNVDTPGTPCLCLHKSVLQFMGGT